MSLTSEASGKRRVRGKAGRIVHAVLIALNVPVALLFAAGYAGRYVHPADAWILQLFALGLPVLALGLLLLGAAALILKSRRIVVLNGLLVLLYLFRTAPFERVAGVAQPENADSLIVMSFNTGNLTSRGDDTLVDEILTEMPDVLALQETPVAFTNNARVLGSHRELLPLFQHYELRRPEVQPGSNAVVERGYTKTLLPIFSRDEFRRYEEIELRTGAPGTSSQYVVLTRAEFDVDESRVAVYNVHLRSYGAGLRSNGVPISRRSPAFWRDKGRTFASDTKARAAEAEAIRTVLDSETLPFIVCGDLNSTPESWVYRHLSRGLQDAFRSAGGFWGATFHSDFPAVRIDYILASRDWAVLETDELMTKISDHRPVKTLLALRPKAEQH